MAELRAGGFDPWAIPADAVVVLAHDSGAFPMPWRFLAMGTGFTAIADVAQAVKDQFPELDGDTVLVAQIGGNKSRTKKMAIVTTTTHSLTETDPVAP